MTAGMGLDDTVFEGMQNKEAKMTVGGPPIGGPLLFPEDPNTRQQVRSLLLPKRSPPSLSALARSSFFAINFFSQKTNEHHAKSVTHPNPMRVCINFYFLIISKNGIAYQLHFLC